MLWSQLQISFQKGCRPRPMGGKGDWDGTTLIKLSGSEPLNDRGAEAFKTASGSLAEVSPRVERANQQPFLFLYFKWVGMANAIGSWFHFFQRRQSHPLSA